MTPWVLRLLVANVIVFFLQMTVPGITGAFAFMPAYAIVRPWTFVTYMFLHGGFTHILFNMIALYFFGPRVEERMGSRRFITLYAISGVSGAILSSMFSVVPGLPMLLSPYSAIIGASGAVFGVMLAFASFWPRAQIYIWGILPVEAWLLVIATAALALFFGFSGGGGGVAHFAHLGGFAGAFLYLKWLDRRAGARRFRKAAAPKVQDRTLANWKKVDTSKVHEVNRDELNRILDKISTHGLGSLTPQERGFLSSFVPPDDRVPPVS